MAENDSDDDILAMLDELLLEEIELKTFDEYLEDNLLVNELDELLHEQLGGADEADEDDYFESDFWDDFDIPDDIADQEDPYSEDK